MLTVTVPAATYDLTTVATVKAALGLSGTADDTFLGDLITEASGAIRRYTNRTFAVETVVETIRPSRALDAINLVRWPVTAVSSVVEDGATLTSADYETDVESGLVYRLSADTRRPWTARKVVLTYSAGFATIPADVVAATVALVRLWYFRRGTDPWVRSVDAGNIKLALNADLSGPEGLPVEVVSLIVPFRMPAVG